jgi:hypothetical protein
MIFSCPRCGKSITTRLKEPWLVLCTNCQAVVSGDVSLPDDAFRMPDDWSVIQMGTKGQYKQKEFTIVGRARLQMPADFINLWCAQYPDGPLWIGQSLEKIGFFNSVFTPYPPDRYRETRAGLMLDFSDTIRLKCELLDECINLQFEGELHRLPFSRRGFKFVQASNASGNTVFVLTDSKVRTEFLWGELMVPDSVKFSNIREYSEWK